MELTRILYICQEIYPYTPETIVSKLCRELPQYIQENGDFEVRVFMPCYGSVNERRHQLHEVQRLSGLNLIVDDNDHQLIIKVASIQSARLQIYFIDNDTYFKRKAMYLDDKGNSFVDNDERMIFYARGVLETIKKLRWTPDIIHCSGFLTSLAPLYVRTMYSTYPFFANSKIVYTVYDDSFKNQIDSDLEKKISIPDIPGEEIFKGKKISWATLIRLASIYSDVIVEGQKDMKAILKDVNINDKIEYLKYEEESMPQYLDLYKKLTEKNI